MKESQFQLKVIKWFEQNKIYAIKQNASGISKAGVPDILANVNGLFMGIEIKKDVKSKATELQKYNINMINNQQGVACVLRPETFELFKKLLTIFLLDNGLRKTNTFRENIITRIGIE